jgi:DNA-binding HxlR family transcriptional regulator
MSLREILLALKAWGDEHMDLYGQVMLQPQAVEPT